MSATPRKLHVVSAQFPCGAAWLANALIELGLPIEHLWGFDTDREWQTTGEGERCYVAEHLPWRQTLASLQLGRRFRPRTDWVARFSHEFPWQSSPADCVIVIQRDPRDALYSEWRRHRRNRGLSADIGLPEFVALPFEGGPINQRDLLWLHSRCWGQQALQSEVVVLRFEDFKQRPQQVLTQLSQRMQLSLAPDAIEAAIAASDVRRLQGVEAALSAEDPAARQFNRRGQAFEWREAYDWTWHRLFGRHWLPVFAASGYPPPPYLGTAQTEFCIDATLTWRGLVERQQRAHWRSWIEHWQASSATPSARLPAPAPRVGAVPRPDRHCLARDALAGQVSR